MNTLIRLTALISLSYTLTILLKTGDITYYINPRFVPLTKFSLSFLLLLSFLTLVQFLLQLKNGPVTKNTARGVSILVLLACLTPFAFPPKMLGSSMAEQKGRLSIQRQATPQQSDLAQEIDDQQPQVIPDDMVQMKAFTNADGLITLTSNNYLELLFDMLDNQQRYLGKELEVTGFILHHKALKPDQYLVARYAIACCAADATIIGFVVEGTTSIPDNSWVKIRGTVTHFDQDSQPIVKVTSIEQIEQPTDPYIYQY
ncbi:TIGR03943 family putative permease subunit [Desulforamulus aeronauticus]|uniref:TIGR03943 family protein n=1 Tax=Desulforamulus aeronauticus DSM 10349 TaxID=1121421 RepID=A0A1M6WQD6_9FIRM|nr:TIGR03943 family protein [Desulforamulus aeronauticus]SHK95876.1 TIGR03943 family protein [Desulforamulus aeronauticus DSM 10349]